MSRDFIVFTKEEFEQALADCLRPKKDGKIRLFRDPLSSDEFTYSIVTGYGMTYIKVYSSVDSSTGKSRSYASDAIRFVIMDKLSERPVSESKAHVKRITSWKKNLGKRIDTMFEEVKTLTFCDCGSPKVERTNRATGEKFLGCLNYSNAHKKVPAL